MIDFSGSGILLDIEGTTSSIRFVYDEMFPFVRRELSAYLQSHWGEDDLGSACDQIANDAGHESLTNWSARVSAQTGPKPDDTAKELIATEVIRLMDNDVKATGLKQLQGLIWKDGFHSGELQAHVYEDVPPALKSWSDAGIDLRIYSSGSIAAQKLFFGHTIAGNLLSLFRGHYDTTTGAKQEASSYAKIALEYETSPREILFLSDVVAELDAARTAGFETGLLLRPGNAEASLGHTHPTIELFTEITLVRS